jgi:hypothetical protein
MGAKEALYQRVFLDNSNLPGAFVREPGNTINKPMKKNGKISEFTNRK